jgi:hypothetical protein
MPRTTRRSWPRSCPSTPTMSSPMRRPRCACRRAQQRDRPSREPHMSAARTATGRARWHVWILRIDAQDFLAAAGSQKALDVASLLSAQSMALFAERGGQGRTLLRSARGSRFVLYVHWDRSRGGLSASHRALTPSLRRGYTATRKGPDRPFRDQRCIDNKDYRHIAFRPKRRHKTETIGPKTGHPSYRRTC